MNRAISIHPISLLAFLFDFHRQAREELSRPPLSAQADPPRCLTIMIAWSSSAGQCAGLLTGMPPVLLFYVCEVRCTLRRDFFSSKCLQAPFFRDAIQAVVPRRILPRVFCS